MNVLFLRRRSNAILAGAADTALEETEWSSKHNFINQHTKIVRQHESPHGGWLGKATRSRNNPFTISRL